MRRADMAWIVPLVAAVLLWPSRAGAFRKQGEAMTQAFTQQGQVLAELLRRTA